MWLTRNAVCSLEEAVWATKRAITVTVYLHLQWCPGLKRLNNAWRHSLAINWLNLDNHTTKEDGASSYTMKTSSTRHFHCKLSNLGLFPRVWGTLAYINACKRERDDFTDSKYSPLWRRTLVQFRTQVFHRASLSGGIVLQVRDKKACKILKCSGS